YAIVQEHGGRIRLESTPNAGVSFIVELPINAYGGRPLHADSNRTASSLKDQRASVQTSNRRHSILVVEDEARLASAVVDALQDAGYTVEHAADGEEAIASVRARRHDLVLCDLKMPRLDGQAFYAMLQSAAPQLARHV